MYQKSETIKQKDLFAGPESVLGERSRKIFEDPQAWHNLFRRQITNKINESIFKPLFDEKHGRPNAPVRVLVAMMSLKEGLGISDEHLYEEARFNLLVRSALGLINNEDEAPVESTYYLFRKRLVEWEKEHGENLYEEAFRELTREQCLEYKVSGKTVRMDSKLLWSNIAYYSRYTIVHETIKKYWKAGDGKAKKLTEEEKKLLKEVVEEHGEKVTWRNTKDEVEERFWRLGELIYWMLKEPEAEKNPEYGILKRVFEEQYEITEGPGGGKKAHIKTRKEQGKVMSSPHDTEAEYRKKAGSKVEGYSINVTETCDEGELRLITDVKTEGASAADVDFFQGALERTQEVVANKIEEAHTDGAYHSPWNQEYCKEHGIDFILGKISGKPSKYDLSFDGEGNLVVIKRESGEKIEAVRTKTKDKDGFERWRVKDGDHAPIYFDKAEVEVSLLRKRIAALPKEKTNIRNNIEATILQLGYHYRHDKSVYRGKSRHRLWALSRCMWINFRRIMKWLEAAGDNIRLLETLKTFSRSMFNRLGLQFPHVGLQPV